MAFTLAGPCEYREEIRKSRFLALATPVESAQQALAFIDQHRDAGASHNCWAFKCGAQYRFSERVSFSARINNLLDKDFTSFQTLWNQDAQGVYTPSYLDDYNNKDKSRNLWLSLNVGF